MSKKRKRRPARGRKILRELEPFSPDKFLRLSTGLKEQNSCDSLADCTGAPFPLPEQLPEHLRHFCDAMTVELPAIDSASTSGDDYGIYPVTCPPLVEPGKGSPLKETIELSAAAAKGRPRHQGLLFLPVGRELVDWRFATKHWLNEADEVLRDENQPLLARHLAKEFILGLLHVLASPSCPNERALVTVLTLGELFERMYVASVEKVALHGRRDQRNRSKGGNRTKEMKAQEFIAQKTRLTELVMGGKTRSEALKEIGNEENLQVSTLTRKMTGVMTTRGISPQKN